MIKKVRVDRNNCISCGLCISLAPEVFHFEENKSIAYNQEGAPDHKIQECIDGCPVSAIHWGEYDS